MRCKATGKVKHASKEAAIVTQRRVGNPTHVNVFKCGRCGGWHLGRSNSPIRWSDRIGQLLQEYEENRAKKPGTISPT